MRETWYVLEDGSPGDPRDVAPDAAGVLRHSGGVAVAMRGPGVPRTSGVDLDDRTGEPLFGGKGDHDDNGSTGGAKHAADMQPEVPPPAPAKKPGYKTRAPKG